MAPTSRSGDLDEAVHVSFLPPRRRAGDPIAGTGQLLLRAVQRPFGHLVMFAPLYGCLALLIRELVHRARLGQAGCTSG
jgi:hypothetical protein